MSKETPHSQRGTPNRGSIIENDTPHASMNKDIVINNAPSLSMGLMPPGQLFTLQFNNVSSKPLEKISSGPAFSSASRGHNTPVPILAKPAYPNASQKRPSTASLETVLCPQRIQISLRHKSSQTDPLESQWDVFSDILKKVAFTLDALKVTLNSVQSKVASLEARFAAVYGDKHFEVVNQFSTGTGRTAEHPEKLPKIRCPLSLTSSRFWANKRLACRLATEKLQQKEVKRGNHHPSPIRRTVRSSRRLAANPTVANDDDDQTAVSSPPNRERLGPVTKAKIAKLLMAARLEMAAEEKERLEIHSSSVAVTEKIQLPHMCGDQQSTVLKLVAQNETDPLPPILPLPTTPSPLGTCKKHSVNHKLPDEITTASRTLVTNPPKPSSPSVVPQLPPIPAKYRRPILLDTSEIARQMRDMLLKCAISQRSFGQNVLGLSQGSVSDLLTRPKPWSTLTSKGREPFIRMKLFLENPRSLNGFEYNVSAGKSGTPFTMPASQLDKSVSSSPKSLQGSQVGETPSSAKLAVPDLSGIEASTALAVPGLTPSETLGRSTISVRSPDGQRLLREGFDVIKTVADAKLLLNTTSMTQRVLGNTVLGLSQASVSDLLCKCRPWDQISGNKPRESYVRLKLWVDSMNQTSTLQSSNSSPVDGDVDVTEQDSKRRRLDSGSPVLESLETQKMSDQHLEVLVNFFNQCPVPDQNDLTELAKQIGCSLSTVIDWFKNQRSNNLAKFTVAAKGKSRNLLNEHEQHGTQIHSSTMLTSQGIRRRKTTVPTRILPPSIGISEALRDPLIVPSATS